MRRNHAHFVALTDEEYAALADQAAKSKRSATKELSAILQEHITKYKAHTLPQKRGLGVNKEKHGLR